MESIIIPPPDIREIIETTGQLVREGGKEVEVRILSTQRNNPKYCFLNQNDPYHPYYLKSLQEPLETIKVPAKVINTADEDKKMVSLPSLDEIFPHKMPYPPISAYDLDILRMTALFAAANEPSFVSNLLSREMRNPQFDFLKIDHSLNALYRKLIASYEHLLELQSGHSHENSEQIFTLVRDLSISELSKSKTSLAMSDDPIKETLEYDWSNFVIGDVLEFTDKDLYVMPIVIDSLKNSSSAVKQSIYELQNISGPVSHGTQITEQYVVCPICKGSVPSSEFEKHFRLETISASSSTQRKSEQSKYVGVPLETSADAVKRNLTSMLGGQNQSYSKKRK